MGGPSTSVVNEGKRKRSAKSAIKISVRCQVNYLVFAAETKAGKIKASVFCLWAALCLLVRRHCSFSSV